MAEPECYIIGAGAARFRRPGGSTYQDMVGEAVRNLFQELPSVTYGDVQAAVCSFNYGAPTCGQAALRKNFGATGIPIFNTNNNCCAGSSALYLGRNLLKSGDFDLVLVVGFEEMGRGLSVPFPEMVSPVQDQFQHLDELDGVKDSGVGAGKLSGENQAEKYTMDTVRLFAKVAEEKGYSKQLLAEIAAKNRHQGRNTEYAMLSQKKDKEPPTAEEIEKAPPLFGSTTIAMAGPTGNGAAAVLLCSRRFLSDEKHKGVFFPENTPHGKSAAGRAVGILSQALVSDQESTFSSKSFASLAGYDCARKAVSQALAAASLKSVSQVSLFELHDCFSVNEAMLYEALGLLEDYRDDIGLFWGDKSLAEDGFFRFGKKGDQVINPSGGLITKGHPIGATGVAQAAEIFWQLTRRFEQAAGSPAPTTMQRQVHFEGAGNGDGKSPLYALSHNYGFNGGACVTLYQAAPLRPSPAEHRARL